MKTTRRLTFAIDLGRECRLDVMSMDLLSFEPLHVRIEFLYPRLDLQTKAERKCLDIVYVCTNIDV